jgi:hypothetical protein
MSFFDENDRYEIREAKPYIAKARRAAFEYAVYASPGSSLKAISAIEAVNIAASSTDPQQLASALQAMEAMTKEMVTSFYKECKAYEQDHHALLK